jgi:Acylphosphatases
MTRCVRCWVSGRVQGVFFRFSTKEQALALGMKGWVRNLPDGRVEVLACGEAHAIIALRNWLHIGPPHAHVTDLECEPAAESGLTDFRIL